MGAQRAVGSRSVEKAQEFINKIAPGNKSIAACGSYAEVYSHKVEYLQVPTRRRRLFSAQDVDAIYIGRR